MSAGSKKVSGPLEPALTAAGDPPQAEGQKRVGQKKRQRRYRRGDERKEHEVSRAMHAKSLVSIHWLPASHLQEPTLHDGSSAPPFQGEVVHGFRQPECFLKKACKRLH
jgi:hypothetical protein